MLKLLCEIQLHLRCSVDSPMLPPALGGRTIYKGSGGIVWRGTSQSVISAAASLIFKESMRPAENLLEWKHAVLPSPGKTGRSFCAAGACLECSARVQWGFQHTRDGLCRRGCLHTGLCVLRHSIEKKQKTLFTGSLCFPACKLLSESTCFNKTYGVYYLVQPWAIRQMEPLVEGSLV